MKGDRSDIVRRLKSQLPNSWFANDATPVLDTVLTGVAAPLTWIYDLYCYTLKQTRIGTSTGVWIDRSSYDFLGDRLPRKATVDSVTLVKTVIEQDDAYRARVLQEIMRPRVTRDSIGKALTDLTGVAPRIFEPWNTNDCGAYGIGTSGYGVAGCYGSTLLNNQMFITAVRPQSSGVPNVGGYGLGPSFYGVIGEYIDQSQITGPVTDADIYRAVKDTVAAGVTGWTAIVTSLPAPPDSDELTQDQSAPTFDSGIVKMDHW